MNLKVKLHQKARALKSSIKNLGDRRISAKTIRWREKMYGALGHQTILVYTMGKVGSTAVYESLKSNGVSKLVYHVHFLTESNIRKSLNRYGPEREAYSQTTCFTSLARGEFDHLAASIALSSMRFRRKIYIVSLVRDPVATHLSLVFQNPHIHRSEIVGPNGKLQAAGTIEEISNYFKNFDPNSNYLANWFDNEFASYTGIDVYSQPFDHDRGTSVLSNDNFRVAIISLDKLGTAYSPTMSTLLERKLDLALGKANQRSDTADGDLYAELKKSIAIPVEQLERVYSTKFARHFFSDTQRANLIKKWSSPRM